MSRPKLRARRYVVPAFAIAVATGAILLGPLAFPRPAEADLRTLISPGALSAPHANLDAKCDSCHIPFKGVADSACLSCHTATAGRISGGKSTHAAFAREGKRCKDCHHDHKGRGFALSPPVAADFNHAVTGFALSGAHAGAKCESCHKPGARPASPTVTLGRGSSSPKTGPTTAQSTKWAGLPRDCGGCHIDAHKGALGPRCVACHDETAFKPARHTIAEHKLPLSGAHTGKDCVSCHKGGTHLSATSSCGDCHGQPHGGTKAPCATCHNPTGWKNATFAHDFCTCILQGKHQTAPCLGCHPAFKFVPTTLQCVGCHLKDRKHEELGACSRCHSTLTFKASSFDHQKPSVGFAITGRHEEVGCENCHTKAGVFRGAPKNCAGCHQTPAHGDFGECSKCHTTAGFERPTFSHDKTRFPLDGAHAKMPCQSCHAKLKPGGFKLGPKECTGCHDDPHGLQFGSLTRGVRLASNATVATVGAGHIVSAGRGCLDCHGFNAWKPSTINKDNHRDFGFALTGKHAGVDCARCHDEGRFAGTPNDCASCHVDRHAGHFGSDCRRCHDESGWRNHPAFDHKVETGFALTDAHAKAACADCHGPDGRKLDGASPPGVTCATCHDVNARGGHGLQFGADCARCHKPTRFADVPAFNHATTQFSLERQHMAVRCLGCHSAARGQRLDPNCRFCHDDPHRGRTMLECEECHRADNWKIVRFDHDRSEFRLNGIHFVTACRDCHVADVYSGLRHECLFCHRGDRIRADMKLGASHRMNHFDCSECHKSFKW